MRTTLAIAKKELAIYFTTPWAYVVFTVMLLISSFFFIGNLSQFRQINEIARAMGWARMPPDFHAFKNLTDGVAVPLWGAMLIITLFVAPVLAMRLFAEEKRQKTFELLMTAPVRPIEIVLGKYLAALGMVFTTFGLTIFFPAVLAMYGTSESGSALEWSTILLGYLGMLLWGSACVAIGMFISSLTESQMVAVLVSFVIALAWLLLRGLGQTAEEPFRSVLNYISFDTQLSGLMKGVLDLKALVFCFSVIFFFVFLTHRTVEAQRWR